MKKGINYIVGIFDQEDALKTAVKSIRGDGVKIHEVYTPYAIHGMEDMLGYRMTRLPIASFFFGLTGTTLALTMLYWMMGYDWPMIIGGKDFASLPPFIPVTFELTVLLAAFGMVFTFFVASDLKPWGKPRVFDNRCTQDKYVLVVDLGENQKSGEAINKMLTTAGATEVNRKSFEEK